MLATKANRDPAWQQLVSILEGSTPSERILNHQSQKRNQIVMTFVNATRDALMLVFMVAIGTAAFCGILGAGFIFWGG